jgi:penicillin-binding protein 1A
MRLDQTAQWQPTPAQYQAPGDPASPPPPPPRRPWYHPFRWGWKRILLGILALFMLIVAWLAITAPLSKSLQPIAAPSLTLVSAEGDPIARRGADIREPVSIRTLPKHVPAAFIAIEDKRFHDHLGISIRGIARAAWRNLGAGGVREGGSTITQQLAKISFLSADRTAGAQGAGSADRLLAGSLADQGGDTRALSLQRLSRRQHLRPARRLLALFQRPAREADRAPGGDAGRDGQGAVAARADPQLRRRGRGRVVIAAMIDQGYLTPPRRGG